MELTLDQLPYVCLAAVCEYLSAEDLGRFCRVCKVWNNKKFQYHFIAYCRVFSLHQQQSPCGGMLYIELPRELYQLDNTACHDGPSVTSNRLRRSLTSGIAITWLVGKWRITWTRVDLLKTTGCSSHTVIYYL